MNRQEKLLKLLIDSKGYLHGAQIAKYLGITTRTLRSDIKWIKEKYGANIIYSHSHLGYRFNFEKYQQRIDNEGIYSQNERLLMICYQLITNHSIDIIDLSDELGVSEHTIENDIYKLKRRIEQLHYANYGIIRKATHCILDINCDNRNTLIYELFIDSLQEMSFHVYQKVFTDIDLIKLYTMLKDTFISNTIELKYVSYLKLTLEIGLYITQKLNGFNPHFFYGNLCDQSKTLASAIAKSINKSFDFEINEHDEMYFAKLLEKLYQLEAIDNKLDSIDLEDDLIFEALNKIIDKIYITIGFSGKKVLMDKFQLTLLCYEMVLRKQIDVTCINPLLINISQNNQSIYHLCFNLKKEIDKLNLCPELNYHDFSFIATYMNMVFTKHIKQQLKVAILVPEGISNLFYIKDFIEKAISADDVVFEGFVDFMQMKYYTHYSLIVSTNNEVYVFDNGIVINRSFFDLDKIKLKNQLSEKLKKIRVDKFIDEFKEYTMNDLIFIKSKINNYEALFKNIELILNNHDIKISYDKLIERDNFFNSKLANEVSMLQIYDESFNSSQMIVYQLPRGIEYFGRKIRLFIVLVHAYKSEKSMRFGHKLNSMLINDNLVHEICNGKSFADIQNCFINHL